MLIVRDLASGPRRFVELQRVLPGISTEQLRSRLNRMVADGLLTRQRYREVPPRVDYELTERSRALLPVVGELARWGYDWTWGAPRPGEEVQIGAILRTAPGLLDVPGAVTGTVACEVRGDRGQDRTYILSVARGQIDVSEEEIASPDATVSGELSAWVRALGPEADASGLRMAGRSSLAEQVLAGFFGAARRADRRVA